MLSALTITQPGVYIISYTILSSASAASFYNPGTWVDDNVPGPPYLNYIAYQQLPFSNSNISGTISLSGSQIYTVTATTTFSLYCVFFTITAGSIAASGQQFSFKFIRIA